MAQLRGSEMLFGRRDGPDDYVDTTATPVVTRYANHGTTAPSPYDGPPLPPYDSISQYPPAPSHFLPPYDYVSEPAPSIPPRGGGDEFPPSDFAEDLGTRPIHSRREPLPAYDLPGAAPSIPPRGGGGGGGYGIPPNDLAENVGTRPPHSRREPVPPYGVTDPALSMPPRGRGYDIPPNDLAENVGTRPLHSRREPLPPHDPPANMVIPGVLHPDGSFEPHPNFAHRAAPLGFPMEPEGPVPTRRSAPLGPSMDPEVPIHAARTAAPLGPPMEPEVPLQGPTAAPGAAAVPTKQTVEVAVPVCCEECKERITNYVGRTPGVDSVECDVYDQRVKVTGDLTPGAVLRRCQKCFKKSTLID